MLAEFGPCSFMKCLFFSSSPKVKVNMLAKSMAVLASSSIFATLCLGQVVWLVKVTHTFRLY